MRFVDSIDTRQADYAWPEARWLSRLNGPTAWAICDHSEWMLFVLMSQMARGTFLPAIHWKLAKAARQIAVAAFREAGLQASQLDTIAPLVDARTARIVACALRQAQEAANAACRTAFAASNSSDDPIYLNASAAFYTAGEALAAVQAAERAALRVVLGPAADAARAAAAAADVSSGTGDEESPDAGPYLAAASMTRAAWWAARVISSARLCDILRAYVAYTDLGFLSFDDDPPG